MHTVIVVLAVVIGIPLILMLSPRGFLTRRAQMGANRWAEKRNAAGKGNLLTRPMWGSSQSPED